jgi:MFS superfamily sulfate permease-like transporter
MSNTIKKQNKLSFTSLSSDFPAGLVVFFVALPLCLGIALASGASPFAGIISGIIGGIVVGYLSGSHVSVTGPAAGLIAIIFVAIKDLGFDSFLLAVVLAGIIQLVLGFLKAGSIASYFPTAVIEGMLAAIGIIIIKKELPHAFGIDKEHEGDYFDLESGIQHSFVQDLIEMVNFSHVGIILIAAVSFIIIILFNKVAFFKKIKLLPSALIVVIVGIIFNEIFIRFYPSLVVTSNHLVNLPKASGPRDFLAQFTLPNFSDIGNPKIWIVAFTIAIVASIETLLCIEAGDKMDAQKRFSDANRELRAQGIGNILSGLIGGLPMTSVIVRTSANVNAGAKSKLAAVLHGLLLLVAVVLIPRFLNKIPLACLAAILIMTGLRLANPKVFKHMWHNGWNQFIPFLVTVIAVVFTDLLKGVGAGLIVSIFYILKGNMKLAYFIKNEEHHEGETITIDLAQEVSFLNKAAIKETLRSIPNNSKLIIDAGKTVYIDFDVIELIKDFVDFTAKSNNIDVKLINFKEHYNIQDSKHCHLE